MNHLDSNLLKRIKGSVRLEQIVAESVDLKMAGKSARGRCPFCEGNRGFSVSIPKQLFGCFRCNTHGDVFKWLEERHGLSFPEAVKQMAAVAGIPLPESDSKNFSGTTSVRKRSLGGRKRTSASQSAGSDAGSASPNGDPNTDQKTCANGDPNTDQKTCANGDPNTDQKTCVNGDPNTDQKTCVNGDPNTDQKTCALTDAHDGDLVEVVDTKRAENHFKNQSASRSSGSVDRPDGLRLLSAFYDKLHLSDEDQLKTWEKRGLSSSVQYALGFRTNEALNRTFIEQVSQSFSTTARLESGLWLKGEEGDIYANNQFHGKGIVSRTKDDHGKDVTNWGWNQPMLIPYFDESHQLIALRPHKGNATSTRTVYPRLYVPRRFQLEPELEVYEHVFITEGEFKAAALWRMIGRGTVLFGNYLPLHKLNGVCAIPGIAMWNNDRVWLDICNFLIKSCCRSVTVIFDNELKPESVPAEKANDALIRAIGLASRVKRELGITAKVGKIPDKYRDATGKADFDGMLAQIVHGAGKERAA